MSNSILEMPLFLMHMLHVVYYKACCHTSYLSQMMQTSSVEQKMQKMLHMTKFLCGAITNCFTYVMWTGSDGYPLPYPTWILSLLPVPYPEMFSKFQGSG